MWWHWLLYIAIYTGCVPWHCYFTLAVCPGIAILHWLCALALLFTLAVCPGIAMQLCLLPNHMKHVLRMQMSLGIACGCRMWWLHGTV